jgi:hypothetical protein
MATKVDWLPRNHEALKDKSTQTITYLDGKFGDFGINGKSAEWINTIVKPAKQRLDNAFLAWQNPATRTPAMTAVLQEAEAEFIPLYRELYIFLKANPLVKNDDLLLMDLPERSTAKPTPAPDPATVPEAEVALPSPGVVIIHYRDSGANKRAKPEGVHGVEIAWAVLDTPPARWAELTNSVFDTKTPYTLTFENDQRGLKLYYALRWENTRGVKGNWSEIYEAVIP